MSRIQTPRNLDAEIPDSTIRSPEAAEPGNRRQWPRYALSGSESFTVTVAGRPTTDGGTDGGPGTDGGTCTIEDISLGGARLRMDGPALGGLEIRIEHPRLGHAYARRRWKAKNYQGVTFDHSMPSLAFIAECMAEGVEVGHAEPAA
jgi:hypothetical protein